jgi:hypothetical protein
MLNHLRGLSLLYFILGFVGVVVTLFEAPFVYHKIFAVGYGALLAFQLLNYHINDEN